MIAPIWSRIVWDRMVGADHRGDLPTAPSLDEQLAALDQADDAGDEAAYVDAWLICVEQVGCQVSAEIHADGTTLRVGSQADEFDRERLTRFRALRNHMDVAGQRQAVLNRLERQPDAIDNPGHLRRHARDTLRRFLRDGFRCFATPDGEIEEAGALPAEWFDTPLDTRREEIARTGRAYLRLKQQPYGQYFIGRAILMLGKLHEPSGCLVLEREIREAAHA